MKAIDRAKFFAGYRAEFGRLRQSQVDGLQILLAALETDPYINDARHAAYMLATVRHECADTWMPILERGGPEYLAKYEPGTKLGRQLGNTRKGDSLRYPGRGYAMITGYDNYLRMGRALGMGYGLVTDPEAALDPAVAYRILSSGMRLGLFTGRKLSDFIDGGLCDYVAARRIINGTDRAELIATYAAGFEQILGASVQSKGG